MRFTIAPDDPCLAGHFPGRPLVPGVVILEQVLQAIERTHGVSAELRLPQVKFLQPLLPGVEAEVRLDGAPGQWRFQVHSQGQLLASGQIREGVDG